MQLTADVDTLVNYEGVKENFVGINGGKAMKTYLDMGNNYIYNLKKTVNNDQAANKGYVDTQTSAKADKTELADYLKKNGTVAMTGDFNVAGHKILNLRSPTSNSEPATKFYTDVYFPKTNGQTPMNGRLDMGGKKIVNIATPTADGNAATKKYVDDHTVSNYLKLDRTTPMKGILNMYSYKITNVYMDHTSETQATNKQYADNLMHHSQVQPSHVKDQFVYLMTNILEWTDEMDGGNSVIITKIDDLSTSKGNTHTYNHKVLYTTIIKSSQGG